MPVRVKTDKVAKGRSKGSIDMSFTTLILLALAGAIAAPPTFVVIYAGMLPTGVAFITDQTRTKHSARCVAGLNLAGVAPFVFSLWSGTHSLEAAFGILTDTFTWLVMYGAASLGWVLTAAMPPVASVYLEFRNNLRLNGLQTRQQKLVADWGAAVARAGQNGGTKDD